MLNRRVKETEIYANLVKNITNTLFQSVENCVGAGTPDIYFSNSWNQGWSELKQFELPKRPTTQIVIDFRPGQYGWLRKFTKAGSLCMLICSTSVGLYVFIGKNIKRVYRNRQEFESLATLVRPRSYDDIRRFFNTKIKNPD